jgi:Sigma-70 region 2
MRGSSAQAQRFGHAERLSSVDVTMHMAPGPDDVVPATGTLQPGEGDAGAALSVSALFRDHHLELVRLAAVMVGDLATAEDVVQDSFERLHRRWPAIREPSRRWPMPLLGPQRLPVGAPAVCGFPQVRAAASATS